MKRAKSPRRVYEVTEKRRVQNDLMRDLQRAQHQLRQTWTASTGLFYLSEALQALESHPDRKNPKVFTAEVNRLVEEAEAFCQQQMPAPPSLAPA